MNVPFEVFMKIAYFIDDGNTYQQFSLVCKRANKGCMHVKSLKQWQWTKLFVVVGKGQCNVYDSEETAKSVVEDKKHRPELAIATQEAQITCFSTQRQTLLDTCTKYNN